MGQNRGASIPTFPSSRGQGAIGKSILKMQRGPFAARPDYCKRLNVH